MIKLGPFGGIMPALEGARLPDNAAQTAQDVELRRGVLEPIAITTPFTTMITGGELKSEIPAGDVKTITKPDAPYLAPTYYESISGGRYVRHAAVEPVCQPWMGSLTWLKCTARTWVTWVADERDAVSGEIVGTPHVELIQNEDMALQTVEYTEAGMMVTFKMSQFDYTFTRKRDSPYKVYGPLFQFTLEGPNTAYGSPDSTTSLPAGVTYLDPHIPGGSVPLVYDSDIYAAFQVVDYAGPIFDSEIFFDYASTMTKDFPPDEEASVTQDTRINFAIALNYTNPARRHLFYVQTAVTADDEEGPPSEISDEIVLLPGEKVTLTTTRPSGYTKNRLYRSSTGGDDFLLIDDINADSYTDWNAPLKTTELPPYGNYPASDPPLEADKTTFLAGSVIHPAQFGAAFWTDKNLYFTDYYRFWAWPEEYAVPFEAVPDAIALAGNTFVVFVNDRVYGVSGGNPEAMAKFLISDEYPLLDKTTICKVGGLVVYCCRDGLAACDGSSVRILTKNHYTRTQWMALSPDTFTAKVADNSVFLDYAGGGGLRFDIDGSEIACSTYTATTASPFTWKSKIFHFNDKTTFVTARIDATAAVTLKVYGDGVLLLTQSITDKKVATLGSLAYAHDWEFEVSSAGVIRSMEFEDVKATPIPVNGFVIRQAEGQSWRRRILTFKESGSFSSVRVVGTDYTGMTLTLTAGGVAQTPVTITDSSIVKLAETLPNAREWELDIAHAGEIREVHLFGRVNYPVKNGLVLIRQDSDPANWTDKRIITPQPVQFNSARIIADTYPVPMTIYHGSTLLATVSAADEKPFRLPKMNPERLLCVNATPASGGIIHEIALATSMARLTNG